MSLLFVIDPFFERLVCNDLLGLLPQLALVNKRLSLYARKYVEEHALWLWKGKMRPTFDVFTRLLNRCEGIEIGLHVVREDENQRLLDECQTCPTLASGNGWVSRSARKWPLEVPTYRIAGCILHSNAFLFEYYAYFVQR